MVSRDDLRRAVPVLLLIPGLMACASSPPGGADPAAQAPPVVAPGAPAAAPGATAAPVPVAGQPAVTGAPGLPAPKTSANGQAGAAPERAPAVASANGLVALPSARQLIASLPLGRRDPFASPFPPLPAPATASAGVPPRYRNAAVPAAGAAAGRPGSPARSGSAGLERGASATAATVAVSGQALGLRFRPAPLVPPEGFRVTGLIRAGRDNEAVVQYQSLSGSLRRGDRGGLTTDLLPSGWSVASVDVNQGRLTLQRGQQQVLVDL